MPTIPQSRRWRIIPLNCLSEIYRLTFRRNFFQSFGLPGYLTTCRNTLRFGVSGSAIDYVTFVARSHHAVIRVYDEGGNVIDRHAHAAISKRDEAMHPIIQRFVRRMSRHLLGRH